MPEWIAILLGATVAVVAQLLTFAFIYGGMSRAVKEHTVRLTNIETVLTGPMGHGERLTALEAWRLEHYRAQSLRDPREKL